MALCHGGFRIIRDSCAAEKSLAPKRLVLHTSRRAAGVLWVCQREPLAGGDTRLISRLLGMLKSENSPSPAKLWHQALWLVIATRGLCRPWPGMGTRRSCDKAALLSDPHPTHWILKSQLEYSEGFKMVQVHSTGTCRGQKRSRDFSGLSSLL